MMNEWIGDLHEQTMAGNACVLVTVAGVRGSAPREVGAKMLVTDHETIGTIGGGQLEYKCTQIAFNTLKNEEDSNNLRKFTLGANCGQCCGGVVEVLFESFCTEQPDWIEVLHESHRQREPLVIATGLRNKYLITAKGHIAYPPSCTVDDSLAVDAMRVLNQRENAQRVKLKLNNDTKEDLLLEPVVSSDLNIAIFGAGHVGAATVKTLSSLDCNGGQVCGFGITEDPVAFHMVQDAVTVEAHRSCLEAVRHGHFLHVVAVTALHLPAPR